MKNPQDWHRFDAGRVGVILRVRFSIGLYLLVVKGQQRNLIQIF
jgi:hypothetical protein